VSITTIIHTFYLLEPKKYDKMKSFTSLFMKYSYRFVIIAGSFCYLSADGYIIAVKVWALGPVELSAAVIIFPFSYIFGDIPDRSIWL